MTLQMLQLFGLLGFVCFFGGCGAYFLLFLRRNRFATRLAYARAWTLNTALDARLSEASRPVCLLKAYMNVLLPFWAARDAYILIRLLGSGQLPEFGVLWIASCVCTIFAFLFLRFFDPLALVINAAALLLGAACLFLPPPLSVMTRPPVPAAICGVATAVLFIGYCLRRRNLFTASDLPEPEDVPYDDDTLFGIDEESDSDDAFFGPARLEPDESASPSDRQDETPAWGFDQPILKERAAKHTTLRKRTSTPAQYTKHRAERMKSVSRRYKRKSRHGKLPVNQ